MDDVQHSHESRRQIISFTLERKIKNPIGKDTVLTYDVSHAT